MNSASRVRHIHAYAYVYLYCENKNKMQCVWWMCDGSTGTRADPEFYKKGGGDE